MKPWSDFIAVFLFGDRPGCGQMRMKDQQSYMAENQQQKVFRMNCVVSGLPTSCMNNIDQLVNTK